MSVSSFAVVVATVVVRSVVAGMVVVAVVSVFAFLCSVMAGVVAFRTRAVMTWGAVAAVIAVAVVPTVVPLRTA